jgi:hypothetical protein
MPKLMMPLQPPLDRLLERRAQVRDVAVKDGDPRPAAIRDSKARHVTAMVGHAVGLNAAPALDAAGPPARRCAGSMPDTPTRSDRPDGAEEKSMESPSSPTVTRYQPTSSSDATQ